MMRSVFRAACCALVLGAALPSPAKAEGEVIVSCFRGPWYQVIWDRPNGKFTRSLEGIGYSRPTAKSIATRVCRDQDAVGIPNMLKDLTLRLIRENPRDGQS